MTKVKLQPFSVIGISVRTTNKNNQATHDIPALWNTFMSENTIDKIPNRLEDSIYALYTDYESDYTEGYTTVLGCKVENLDNIPDGMTGIEINKNTYSRFTAEGDLTKGVIYEKWGEIWNSNLNRDYTTDFEVYGEEAQNPTDAIVDIFIGVA
ncbi:AraC family transcriptional regulator [Aquimarina sp. AD10]|uniref:Transcriptional regulator n=1 Tax=Aquimarina aggregata TaxID=1642818 RepID=A0A163AFJ3_9FLAO|nr:MULTISPECIES: GyrI-like domain-containing protein [Aquimarina]AXT63163.1 AraC family transcriptional regulator [Aquimarina sp. AD10]KZS40512.1 transcriptional regulator [Aquimarina aggregata]RKM98622.1 AraC family transcriptional regulator [Aquimarina sp. AD10]